MAQLTVFHYFYRDSVLHRMDVRMKLVCLVLFSVTIGLASSAVEFGLLLAAISVALFLSRLPILRLIQELKLFVFLILSVVIVHALSIPGSSIPLLPWITEEGVLSGLLFAGRLLLIIAVCVILTGTTSLSELKSAVEWFLRPIPFLPATRIAMMINLTFVLIPLIFDQASEMMDAQKARCIDGRRNPVRQIRFLALPLMLQTFRRADELVMAMESRGYSEDRTIPTFVTQPKDWTVLFFSVLMTLFVMGYHFFHGWIF